jgi:hypothetical protein
LMGFAKSSTHPTCYLQPSISNKRAGYAASTALLTASGSAIGRKNAFG